MCSGFSISNKTLGILFMYLHQLCQSLHLLSFFRSSIMKLNHFNRQTLIAIVEGVEYRLTMCPLTLVCTLRLSGTYFTVEVCSGLRVTKVIVGNRNKPLYCKVSDSLSESLARPRLPKYIFKSGQLCTYI